MPKTHKDGSVTDKNKPSVAGKEGTMTGTPGPAENIKTGEVTPAGTVLPEAEEDTKPVKKTTKKATSSPVKRTTDYGQRGLT